MDIIRERTEGRGKPRFISPSAVTDGAGNIFIGTAQTKGEGTAFTRNVLILKLTPAGQVSVVDERSIPDGGLADGVGIVQSGDMLHVFPGAHIGDPTARLYHYTLRVCVPYPQGQEQVGKPGAYIPQEAEVEIDYARIQSMIDQSLARFSLGMPAMMRQALLDVVRTEGLLTEAHFAGGTGSHTVYQQLVNTSFTGAKGALDEMPFGDEEEPQT